MSGTVNISRTIWADPAFKDEPFTECQAWIWLIMEASWKDRVKRVGDYIVPTLRGQCAVSVRFMAKAWSWSPAKVNRFLKRLQKLNKISIETETGVNVISICNYEKYQNPVKTTETESKQNRNRTKTNDKKDSKPEERKIALSSQFDAFWAIVPRKEGKGGAREAFAPAVKKAGIEKIMSAMSNYAAGRIGEDPKFTVTPAKWLNDERWSDESSQTQTHNRGPYESLSNHTTTPSGRRKDGTDPALEHIAHITGLSETPRNDRV